MTGPVFRFEPVRPVSMIRWLTERPYSFASIKTSHACESMLTVRSPVGF